MLVPAGSATALGDNLIVGNPDGRLSAVCVHDLHSVYDIIAHRDLVI